MKTSLIGGVALAWAILGAAAVAQTPQQAAAVAPATFDKTFTTGHSGVFGGKKIAYTAAVRSTVLTDPSGRPGVNFVSTEYVRDGVADPSKRPVIFGWAGGPSGASTAYHMRLLGPRQLIEGEGGAPATMRDNPDSLIDIADIVLIDPAETGFSRVLPGADRAYYYSVGGDAASIVQFIDKWMASHGRPDAPRYVIGGSYGSVRSIRVAYEALKTRPLDGMFMTANSTSIQELSTIVGSPLTLPTLAMVAAYHGKADRRGRSDQQIADDAYIFAMNEYLPALATVQDLTPEARTAMAGKLQAMTGVPAAEILANNLVIPSKTFNEGLLKTEGKVLFDRLDGRNAAAPGAPEEGDVNLPMLRAYMAKDLGVTYPMDQYAATAPDSNSTWDYRGPSGEPRNNWAALLTAVLKGDPRTRVYSANGYYDMTSAFGQGRYIFSRTPLPRDRITVREYPGGHALYSDPPTASLILKDLRRIMTGG